MGNDIRVMFREVKNTEFPAEFYWDDKLLIYKRGNTVSVVELHESLTSNQLLAHFHKFYSELLKHHKGDELAQEGFFVCNYPEMF